MGYREYSPHPALRPYVDRFWVRSIEAEARPQLILPDGCIDLMVRLDSSFEAFAIGTMTRAIVFDPKPSGRVVAVRFRPGAAAPFLALAADELTDRTVTCVELGLRWLAPARLGSFVDLEDAARRLERILLDRCRAL